MSGSYTLVPNNYFHPKRHLNIILIFLSFFLHSWIDIIHLESYSERNLVVHFFNVYLTQFFIQHRRNEQQGFVHCIYLSFLLLMFILSSIRIDKEDWSRKRWFFIADTHSIFHKVNKNKICTIPIFDSYSMSDSVGRLIRNIG